MYLSEVWIVCLGLFLGKRDKTRQQTGRPNVCGNPSPDVCEFDMELLLLQEISLLDFSIEHYNSGVMCQMLLKNSKSVNAKPRFSLFRPVLLYLLHLTSYINFKEIAN